MRSPLPHAGQHRLGTAGKKHSGQLFPERLRHPRQCLQIVVRNGSPDRGHDPRHLVARILQNTAAELELPIVHEMPPRSNGSQTPPGESRQATSFRPYGLMRSGVVERFDRTMQPAIVCTNLDPQGSL